MAKRVFEIKSPLPPGDDGQDPFHLFEMEVEDRVSVPFKATLKLGAESYDISATDLLGKPLTLKTRHNDRDEFFNGLVSQVALLGAFGGYALYELELRPWFWFLKRTANCRIFQEQAAPDIFEKVVKDTHGFSDFRKSLTAMYRQREYCVQYRESDYNFISRLLEEEGIYYFFKHEDGKHTMVLCDANSAFEDVTGDKDIPYRPPGEAQVDFEHISAWHSQYGVRTGTYVLDDFDFTKPKVDLEGTSQVSRQHEHAEFEFYDYPGLYDETKDGEELAKIRIEELQVNHQRLKGASDHRGFRTGHCFNLVEYPREDQNDEYVPLITKTKIESAEVEQMGQGRENVFEVEFTAIPRSQAFRPSRRTPRSVVKGPQTAMVVGKRGEEIWTDKYGRVKVQFHWDREGNADENSSCWIRVSQVWAGKNWGAMQIPRIGQEVVVDFLEGDPDRPLITGRVYNEDEMPPYVLPDNQTQSGIKSRSTKDGTPDNFNELRFEDKAGEEEIYFHAEKDFKRVVENNDILEIGLEKQDPGDQTVEVHNDQTTNINQGNQSTTVKQGNHSLKVSAGESTIEAAKKITLKVGASTITIKPDAIEIKAPQIKVSGDAQAELTSPNTTVQGSAMATVKGGLVKIN